MQKINLSKVDSQLVPVDSQMFDIKSRLNKDYIIHFTIKSTNDKIPTR